MIGREAILDIRIDGPPPGERAGWGSSRQETPPFLGMGSTPASPKAGENLVPRVLLLLEELRHGGPERYVKVEQAP
jgi:hypothetical protein